MRNCPAGTTTIAAPPRVITCPACIAGSVGVVGRGVAGGPTGAIGSGDTAVAGVRLEVFVALGVADGAAGEGALAVDGLVADGANGSALLGAAVAFTLVIAAIVAVHVGMTSVVAILVVTISVTPGAHAVSTIREKIAIIKPQLFKAVSILNASLYMLNA